MTAHAVGTFHSGDLRTSPDDVDNPPGLAGCCSQLMRQAGLATDPRVKPSSTTSPSATERSPASMSSTDQLAGDTSDLVEVVNSDARDRPHPAPQTGRFRNRRGRARIQGVIAAPPSAGRIPAFPHLADQATTAEGRATPWNHCSHPSPVVAYLDAIGADGSRPGEGTQLLVPRSTRKPRGRAASRRDPPIANLHNVHTAP
jgi:hypothetical protein